MTLSFRKVLFATTAFVAVTASANAATTTYAVSQTTTISNTGASDIVNVSGTSTVISVTGNPAVSISGTGSYTLNTSASSIIRSDSVTGTISLGANNNVANGLTITNAGSIINTNAGGAAISLTEVIVGGAAPSATIVNTGTISGSVLTGASDDSFTNSGTVNGAINLGAGNNSVTVSSGTVTGNITTTGGNDTYSQTNGTVVGNVNLGDGTNTFNMTDGRISGTVTLGTGTDTVTYTGGTITGDIDGVSGNDTINVSGTRVWNLSGDIKNFDTVNISNTTVNLNSTGRTIAGAGAINIDTGAALNVSGSTNAFGLANNGSVNVSGSLVLGTGATIDNDNGAATGTLRIGTGGSVRLGAAGGISTDLYVGTDNAKLIFDVGTSSTAGRLDVGQAAADLTNTSVSIVVGANAGYIASGTQFAIVTDAAGTTTGTLLTTQQGVYNFNLARSGNNVSLTIGRLATASLVDSDSGKAVANALDALGTNADSGDMRTIQNTISAQTTAAGVNSVVESLAPATDTGVGMASLDIGTQSNNTINTRLAGLRGSALSGLNTGDSMANGHMWMQGFGNITNQDNHNGNAGFNANTAGATAGVDTDTLLDGFTTGGAFTFGQSNVNSKSSNDAHTDIDSYMGTLYGSKAMEDGYFVNGQLAYAYDTFKSKRNVIGFGSSTDGSWNGSQYSARIEGGRDLKCNNWLLTPLASAQYTLLDQESYTESGPAALTVNPGNLSAFDLGVGAEGGYTFAMDNGGAIRPRARAKLNYRAGDTQVQTTSNFVAGGSSFTTNGISADRGSVDLGAGVLLSSADGVDFSVDYDADIRSSSTGHTGQVKIRWPF